jgi:hypothetical protein
VLAEALRTRLGDSFASKQQHDAVAERIANLERLLAASRKGR